MNHIAGFERFYVSCKAGLIRFEVVGLNNARYIKCKYLKMGVSVHGDSVRKVQKVWFKFNLDRYKFCLGADGFSTKVRMKRGLHLASLIVKLSDGSVHVLFSRLILSWPSLISNPDDQSDDNEHCDFVFISGCGGDSYRYRVKHQAESLIASGFKVAIYPVDFIDYEEIERFKGCLIGHRQALDKQLLDFIKKFKKRGGKVVYDTDDYVFNENAATAISSFSDLSEKDKVKFLNNIKLQKTFIDYADGATVSTPALLEHLTRSFPDVKAVVSRNVINAEQFSNYIENHAKRASSSAENLITLGYFSGTKTHQLDFEQCKPSIIKILARYSLVKLKIVGLLDVGDLLSLFPNQVILCERVAWRDLPSLYNTIDINLAPLEMGSEFTRCKSDLKYFEASFMKVPTVASCWGEFERVIVHRSTGMLCRDQNDWFSNLEELILRPCLRRSIAEAAFADVCASTLHSSNFNHYAKALAYIGVVDYCV